jgi:hypothetical protein
MKMFSLFSNNLTINRRISLAGVTAWFALLWLCGYPAPVQAEPHLRVCKNGVIYYYFSSRGLSSSPQQALRSQQRIRGHRPASLRRLTPQELEPLIQEASRSHNVPPSLVKAVIRVESNFHPGATSPKGAQGLMQLMPGTADQLLVANPYDPRENIMGGVRYLRMLLEKFNHRLPLALAAYNAGPQRVSQRQEVPAIPETQGFVYDVCTHFVKYSGEQPAPK